MTAPDEFSQALDTIPTRKPGPPCPVAVILAQLDPAARASAEAALVHGGPVQTPRIVRAFAKLGHPIDKYPVGKHRRGDCRCDR